MSGRKETFDEFRQRIQYLMRLESACGKQSGANLEEVYQLFKDQYGAEAVGETTMTKEEIAALLERHGFNNTVVSGDDDPHDTWYEARETSIATLIDEVRKAERDLIVGRLKAWAKRHNERVSNAIDILWPWK